MLNYRQFTTLKSFCYTNT